MTTYFASAERSSEDELREEIAIVNDNPVLSGLLHSVSGLLAVLDENRQIVAVNDSFLKMLGIEDGAAALGLRPGEALQCVHADEEPGGCGTGRYCSTCGAAIAIVASQGHDQPAERVCALTARKNGSEVDIVLLVRSHPIRIAEKRFLLLFLQDITTYQQRAALERIFFHDISNILTGLVGASELLSLEDSQSELVRVVRQSALRLKHEVEMQRCLMQSGACHYEPYWKDIEIIGIVDELQLFCAGQPAARERHVHFAPVPPSLKVKTDMALLLRVVGNMIVNALEATDANGEVRVWVEEQDGFVVFCVWNREAIAEDVARRIFQRNFSTKKEIGRGIGSYAMKLFGEQILGGRVDFTTSPAVGTTFRVALPS
ncbi:MAG: ATP-binding protein [Thermodesulfobacteriota bacterium]